MPIAISNGRSDGVAVPIVIAVVRVMVVVIPVDGHRAVRTIRAVRAWIVRTPSVIGVRSIPTPTVVETAVVKEGIVIVRTVVVVRPPPVVTHVNAYAKAGGTVIVPVHVGEEGVVVTKSQIDIRVKSADTGSVAVVVIVIRIIGAGGCDSRGGCFAIDHLHVGRDHRLAAAWIIGQRTEQISVFVSFINDGVGLHLGGLCR